MPLLLADEASSVGEAAIPLLRLGARSQSVLGGTAVKADPHVPLGGRLDMPGERVLLVRQSRAERAILSLDACCCDGTRDDG